MLPEYSGISDRETVLLCFVAVVVAGSAFFEVDCLVSTAVVIWELELLDCLSMLAKEEHPVQIKQSDRINAMYDKNFLFILRKSPLLFRVMSRENSLLILI